MKNLANRNQEIALSFNHNMGSVPKMIRNVRLKFCVASLIGHSFDESLVLIICHLECPKQIGILCLQFLVFDDIGLFFSRVMVVLYFVSLQLFFENFDMFNSFSVFSGQSRNNLFDLLNLFCQSYHAGNLFKFGSFS
jgi:hypothetical protein